MAAGAKLFPWSWPERARSDSLCLTGGRLAGLSFLDSHPGPMVFRYHTAERSPESPERALARERGTSRLVAVEWRQLCQCM